MLIYASLTDYLQDKPCLDSLPQLRGSDRPFLVLEDDEELTKQYPFLMPRQPNRPVGKQKQCTEATSHLFLDFNPYLKKHSHRNKLKHNRASIAVMISPKQSKKRCSI